MSKKQSDGSTFPRIIAWLNFGAFRHSGEVHDAWVDAGKLSGLGVLVYVWELLKQFILIAVFILPVSIGLLIYECSPSKLKTWFRTFTDRPLVVEEPTQE